ncbi:hypothetical protein HYT92_02430 [Candidatus Pacearchaeota archaeon]|nr:hypothetical protein [Candidatus Pacearchaeota archaeon]
MKKFALILLILIIFIYGCQETVSPSAETKTSNEPKKLDDIQATACNTADEAGTCGTRLAEIGIVLKEDCCEVLGKCC